MNFVLPATMRYVLASRPGGPEVLKIAEGPLPRIAEGDVLVKVAAAGVNRPDILQRLGSYPAPEGASEVLGLEIAGTIVACGGAVHSPRVGDSVCALVTGGGYSEYCAAPAAQCLPIPQPLRAFEAASLPETYFTVWFNLFMRGALKPGETVLIHGGTSGIGTAAIQLAKAFGATVLTTAGTDEKCAASRALGADFAINYREQDFVDGVMHATDTRGVDAVLDIVGGSYFDRNMKALGLDGRLIQIAHQESATVTVNLSALVQKGITITGSAMRRRSVEQKGKIARQLAEHVWPLFGTGEIKPVVYKTFPLADAPEAHRLLESSEHIGKIVLTV